MLDQEERCLTYAEVGELLGTANRRADDDRVRADRAEQQVATLQAELIELRVSERVATDLAEYATGEATDLRKRLDAAEQRAGEERARADRLQAELVELRIAERHLAEKLLRARRWSVPWLLRALGHTR
jgi:hypothetical protein